MRGEGQGDKSDRGLGGSWLRCDQVQREEDSKDAALFLA